MTWSTKLSLQDSHNYIPVCLVVKTWYVVKVTESKIPVMMVIY
jgi:hypothetical protein